MTLIDNEESKMTWFDKLVMNYPKVQPTKSLTDSFQNLQFGTKTVIRPSIWDKAVAIIFSLFAGLFWIVLLRMLMEYRSPFLVILFGFLFVTFLIYLLLKNSFFNKKYIYTITVDEEGLSIDSTKFCWTGIAETCILSRQEGRRVNHYLLIFKKDTTVAKFDLFKFGLSDRKVSTIIEYYRAKNECSI
jgi:hypothetical protein